MPLDPALSFIEYGFSQSRYVALDSLLYGDSRRSNGRDGERPFLLFTNAKGPRFTPRPLLR